VFIRALQLLKSHNEGVVLVGGRASCDAVKGRRGRG
jgi:hypothetical protein